MPLRRCHRCHGLVLKPAQPPSLATRDCQRRRQGAVAILLPLLLLMVSRTVAQPPFTYTPRFYAASTVINRTLYLASGTTATGASSDLVSLSLQESFSTTNVPWKALAKGNPVEEARMAPSADFQNLILVGGRDLVAAYDIATDKWYTPLISGDTFPSKNRRSLGIALDILNRRNVIFGGLIADVIPQPTRELDVLDTAMGQWKWVNTAGATNMPTMTRPIMLYLPQLGATLVMGGCGIGSQCRPFTNVFLIQFSDTGVPIVNNKTVANTDSIVPQPRLMPCAAVLNDGNVLMYGGMGQEGYSDFWALDTARWSWSPTTIKGAPKEARAGATCELVGKNQVMVIGGFTTGMQGERTFSDPQVAIIDMDSHRWTTHYSVSSGLSLGAVVGISVGCSIVLGLLFFWLGRMAYRRHSRQKKNGHHRVASNVDSLSSLPLMDRAESNLASTRLRDEPQSASLPSTKSRNSLPFIITPYSPTAVSSTSSLDVVSPRSVKADTRRLKDEEFPESERLTHINADKQYSQYVKTQQHGKQYERRRQLEEQLQSGNTSLNRSGTHHTYKDDPEDGIELASSVIHLREVELGEEAVVTRPNDLETGAILVSSHLDASPSSNRQHNSGQRQHERRPLSLSPLARTTLHLPREYQGQ